MEPIIKHKTKLTAAGITARTSNELENDSNTARILSLWDKFRKSAVQKIDAGGMSIGVVTDYESDHTGEYTYMAGVAVEDASTVPDQLETIELPEGNYLVFRTEGQPPESVLTGWEAVRNYFSGQVPFKRKYTADYEQYMDGAVEINVAVYPEERRS